MAYSSTEVLQQIATSPLSSASFRAFLMIEEECSNGLHAIKLLILEGHRLKWVAANDMYIAASFDFPTRLVLTLEKLFDLGLNAPAVFVEKGEQLGKLEVGQVTVFICPTLRALSATSATAKVPYWSSIEAEYERALSMVRRHHERKMAAAGLHA